MGTSVGERFWDVYYTTSRDGGMAARRPGKVGPARPDGSYSESTTVTVTVWWPVAPPGRGMVRSEV